MQQSTLHNQMSTNMNSTAERVLDAEGVIDWLHINPGEKLVATRTNVDTGVLAGLRMRLEQDLAGKQIVISLDGYRMAPDTGASTSKLLRLTLARRGSSDVMGIRKCVWRGQVMTLASDDLDNLLAELARVAQSLRRSYLPPIKSLDKFFNATVEQKGE